MSRKQLNLNQAAEALGISIGEMKSLAVQGQITCEKRGDNFLFTQDEIDLWLGQNIITGHTKKLPEPRQKNKEFPKLSQICPPQCVSCDLPGNSRASIIKGLVELADKSGFLYDPADFRDEITRREEAGTTNIGGGIAIPHTLVRDEGYFSETFICIARLAKPVFFNAAPDGEPTDIIILSCSQDSTEHLDILSRISTLCRFTSFIQNVRDAETPQDIFNALLTAEEETANLPKKKRK